MSHIYKSETLEFGEEAAHLEQIGPQLMKIQCLVSECIDPPIVSLITQINGKKFIQFLCQIHFEHHRGNRLHQEFRINCQILEQQNIKNLKQNKKKDLNQALKILDKNSCCMRENIKYQNIKTLYTFYSLVSNNHSEQQEFIKRLLEEKYYLYMDVKQYIDKITKGQKQLNILEAMIQMQKFDNLVKNKECEANILASDQIFSSIRLSKIQRLDEYDR